MSGGVDSSCAAAILKNKGYDIEGVFMRFWSEPGKEGKNLCCSYDAQLHAQAVAQKLGIKLRILNLEKEFKKEIVDYFLREYKAGRTPNPCVKCNQFIKFRFSAMATGHYARIKNGRLFRAKDKIKDQSYFLYNLTQKQLRNILFPVGNYTKEEVKAMAKKWQLPCRMEESFDICFIGGEDHNEFLKRHLRLKPGKIIDTKGNVLGKHQGLPLYTIGQRAGLGGGLFYVLKLDTKNNALIVTDKDEDLYSKELEVKEWHWINPPDAPLDARIYSGKKILAQIRYGHPAQPAKIIGKKVIFNKPQRAITPGQSVVLYKGEKVLGGGIIII